LFFFAPPDSRADATGDYSANGAELAGSGRKAAYYWSFFSGILAETVRPGNLFFLLRSYAGTSSGHHFDPSRRMFAETAARRA